MTPKRRLSLRKLRYDVLVYTSVFISVWCCAYVFNKWIETLLFVIAHLVLRPKFNYQFHVSGTFSDNSICLIVTHAFLWATVPLIPPIKYSLTSAIVFAFCTSYVGSLAQERLLLLAEKSLKLLPFNCKHATATEIKERARRKGLPDEQASWVISKYLVGTTFRELCRQGETEKACQVRIKRIVDKINAPE